MSKRTSEELSNTIEIPDPNNLETGDDEEEVFEGSELDSAVDETPAVGVFWKCSKLVPSNVKDEDSSTVVTFLRSLK
ncbi:hypothetical protein TrST_g1204 [Triparma strigata]|uniref:Uncharacterized protein n=1 Tax=Triparma strigata TaxID=1606541 RepID=A0A9W7EJE7_9STRA|nr:hypothetical protein TrST_g1204 [Triparma strigata]